MKDIKTGSKGGNEMKMTKIAFWKRYLKYQPDDDKFCTSISCKNECPYYSNCEELKMSKEIAKAYIKRHESKSKKKDHILDTTKKVTRPNFRKYLREKIDMKVRVTPELSEELQKIAGEESIKTRSGNLLPKNTGCRIIRFYCCDHYSLVYYPGVVTFEKIEATEYNPETDTLVEKVEEPKPIKTVGIDNSDVALTAQYEPTVKENLSVPQPIKFEKPDTVYAVNGEYIKICHTKGRSVSLDSEGFLLVTTVDGQCRAYATPEQALQVAKKLWNGDGK